VRRKTDTVRPAKLLDSSGKDFSGKDLSGRDFSNRVLVGADFSGSKCDGCNFSGSDLSYAIFKGTDLYKAKFEEAVVYTALFENCNLTRASFDRAFIYGIRFLSCVNVTYCSFEEIQLEERRRKGGACGHAETEESSRYRIVKPGSSMDEVGVSSLGQLDNYYCNGYCFEMHNYSRDEKALHRSQIYNRLKRIFKENNFEKEAADFYFQERYWLTRSWHKQDYSGKIIEKRTKKRIAKTVSSKLSELICGYGERPGHVVGWMLGGWIAYSFLYVTGTFEQPLTSSASFFDQWAQSLYYSICNLVSRGSDMKPLGFTKILAISQSVYGAIFFAILTATIVRKMMRN